MAKVSILAYCNEMTLIGVRSLSSYIRSKGHECQIIYMIAPYDEYYNLFSDELYNRVIESCKDSDLIGMSVTSGFALEAQVATKKLRELGKPIIWGGMHPTLMPEECLKSVEIIALGEAEETLYDLLIAVSEGRDYSNIQGLWTRLKDENGVEKITRNEPCELVSDLDLLPMPDIDYEKHLVVEDDDLLQVTPENLKKHMMSGNSTRDRIDYYVHTSRGCPYVCTFCCYSGLEKLYNGRPIRKRTPENVISELEIVLERYPFFNFIFLSDEEIFVQSEEYLEEFAKLYKEKIGLPLKAEFNPQSFSEKKFKYLVEAGVVEAHIGVQSGSDTTNKDIYARNLKVQKIYETLDQILKYKESFEVFYVHILISNELETDQSRKETLEFVANVDPFFMLTYFPVVYFPGTVMYEMAKEKGLISDEGYMDYLANTGWDRVKELHRADFYTMGILWICRLKNRLGLSIIITRWLNRMLISPLFEIIFNTTYGCQFMRIMFCFTHRKPLANVKKLCQAQKESAATQVFRAQKEVQAMH